MSIISGIIERVEASGIKEIVQPATDTLTAQECRGTQISNYGQSAENTQTLPTAAAGLNGVVVIGTAEAGAFHLKAGATDKIYLDGIATADGEKVSIDTPAVGDFFTFVAFRTGASAYDWMVISGLGLLVNPKTKPFDFIPTGAQTGGVDISLPANKYIIIDWGDGNTTKVSGPVDNQNYTHAYAGAGTFPVTFKGDFRSITRLDINTVNADSTTARLGALSGLTSFSCYGSNTISGDFTNLPTGLTYFRCTGSNTISGDLTNLPTGLTYFNCQGSNTISGDLTNLPAGLTYFLCTGSNTISDYTTKTWTTRPATFIVVPVAPGGLSTAEVDQLLIDFDADLVWSGGSITLTGTNAARSVDSDAAVTNLQAEGVTVTTSP